MAKPAVDPRFLRLIWRYALLLPMCLGGSLLLAQAPPGGMPGGVPGSAPVMPGGPMMPPAGPMLGPQGPMVPGPMIPGPMIPGKPAEEMVMDVRIEGNRGVKIEKILAEVHTRAGRPFDSDTIGQDVVRLNKMRMFVSVKVLTQYVPGGRLVIFRLVERPILLEVKIIGNEEYKSHTLKKELGLKVGDAADPFEVEEGRRRLEDFYHKKGYSKVRIDILEGNRPGQLRAIYIVNEGPRQRVWWVNVVGETVVGGQRIKTVLHTAPPILYLFKGEVDYKEIDEDVKRLTAYYRDLGYFQARVGRELEFNADQSWVTVTFVVDEGPRSIIRNIGIVGNTKFPTEELTAKLKLAKGQPFVKAKLNQDVARLQAKYGGIGYVFADVNGKVDFLDHPGEIDLVYSVSEGARYRVGRVNIEIKGENPHTRITTILERLSLQPGDIVDTREIKDSERRMKASGLFLSDPSKGDPPKIVMTPPNSESKGGDPDGNPDDTPQVADKPQRPGGYRGQSPDGPTNGPQPGDRVIDVTYQYDSIEDVRRVEREQGIQLLPSRPVQPAGYAAPLPPPAAGDGAPLPPPAAELNWQPPPGGIPKPAEPPMLFRGQYTGDAYSAQQAPAYRPAAAYPVDSAYQQPAPAYQQSPQSGWGTMGSQGATAAAYASPAPAGAGVAGGAQAPVALYAQQVPASGAPAPAYGNPPAYSGAPAGTGVASGTPAPANGNQPAYGNQPLDGTSPPYANQVTAAPCPPPGGFAVGPQLPIFGTGSNFMEPSPTGDPLRDLELRIRSEETQTGRIMLGVGINSDAGLVGNIVLDEQNFDWTRVPTTWEDIRNGTAFRGAGERFRIELVPGTEVQRYSVSYQEPYLFDLDSKAVSLGLSGFYYERIFTQWTEEREGGRISLGYQLTHDLTASVAFRGANVNISNPIVPTPVDLTEVLGNNALYGFQVSLAHDTRDNTFLATEGHLFEISFEEVVGSFEYPHAEVSMEQFFKLYERADGSGRHVLSLTAKAGYTGDDTPIYERYYAGGYSSIRGFEFRGISPVDPATGVQIGGDFQLITSVQYMFPITADDMLRGVFFVDAGTVEPRIDDWNQKIRVAPGFGLRIAIPMMGPAPIALDFAFPVLKDPSDLTQVFSFFVGFNH
jgi:outer membrane protein insertion porin family